IRIISLNTMAFTVSKTAARLQTEWLKEVLMMNPQKWTIVMMHHPVYSSTTGRKNEDFSHTLVPLFEKYHVDLVLQGHDHSYGRGSMEIVASNSNQIKGPIYVVSVSGPKMYRSGLGDWMQRGAANIQLYQLITVKEDLLHFEAYTVTGTIYDAFELQKGRKANTFIDLAPKDVKEQLQLPPRIKQRSSSESLDSYRQKFKAYKERNRREDKGSQQQ
ncbi:MAG: metallophosphoesterase, partial [Bacteroidota bacterium]